MEEKKRSDKKMIVGMAAVAAVFLVIAVFFWSEVGRQAQIEKQREAEEEANAISAVYIETGDLLGMEVFLDTNAGTIFTAPVPREGICGEDGEPVRGDKLENGDLVRIYGNGIMLQSFPGQYPGVTKIVRTGHASQEEIRKYRDTVESAMQGTQMPVPEE